MGSLDLSKTRVVGLGKEAFMRAGKLLDVAVPITLRRLRAGCFQSSDLRRLDLSTTCLIEVDRGAFSWTSSLEIVLLPSTLRRLGKDCFMRSGVREVLVLRSRDRKAGGEACCARAARPDDLDGTSGQMTQMHSVRSRGGPGREELGVRTWGDLRVLAWGCFQDCRRLERVELPRRIRAVGWNVFADCSALRWLSLASPERVNGGSVFDRRLPSLGHVEMWSAVKVNVNHREAGILPDGAMCFAGAVGLGSLHARPLTACD